MAATFRLGTLNAAGTAFTELANLNGTTSTGTLNGVKIEIVRDTFKVTPGQRNAQMSDSTSRYSGSIQSSETVGNGQIAASIIVSAASVDTAVATWEKLLTIFEAGDISDYYIEWSPEAGGSTGPVYYEVRGLATWQAQYRWIEFQANKALVFEVSWPVAPLARGLTVSTSLGAKTLPTTMAGLTIGGTAPALMGVTVDNGNTAFQHAWGLLSWAKTPTTPTSGSSVPFGVIESFTFPGTSWAASTSDSTALNSTSSSVAVLAGASQGFSFKVDPVTMVPDSFTDQTIDLELWARLKIPNQPVIVTSVESDTGIVSYTSEYGLAGKKVPSSSSSWVFTRLGTVNVSTATAVKLTINIAAYFDLNSTFAVDYCVVTPARQRALSPTGKTPDDNYPVFAGGGLGSRINTNLPTSKTVRFDLSATELASVTSGGQNASGTSPSLGGQPMEVPPGSVNLFMKMSNGVPDDPTNAINGDTLTVAPTVTVTHIPRYFLVRNV